MLLSAAAFSGCNVNKPAAAPAHGPPSANAVLMSPVTRDTAAEVARGNYTLLVRLRMASIEVPVGMASESEQVWSYLDEERIRPVGGAGLARNGLRVGAGRKSGWDDVSKALGRLTGRPVQESSVLAVPGSSTQIILKQDQPLQTIFTINPDRSVSGCDYPRGDCLLAMSFTLDPQDATSVVLTAMPQVRASKQEPQVVSNGGGLLIVSRSPVYPVESLTFQARVPSGDFVVIGPGAEARRPYTLGHQFLLKQREGLEFETVLVVVPEVFAAVAPASGKAAAGS
jgi:hypothetical protein